MAAGVDALDSLRVFPVGQEITMPINWLIEIAVLFGSFACTFQPALGSFWQNAPAPQLRLASFCQNRWLACGLSRGTEQPGSIPCVARARIRMSLGQPLVRSIAARCASRLEPYRPPQLFRLAQ